MYFNRAKEREKKKTKHHSSVKIYFTHICISTQTHKGKRKLSSLSHVVTWKWQLSVEMVGWGSSSGGSKQIMLNTRLPKLDAAFSSAPEQ